MRILYLSRFVRQYKKLSEEIKDTVKERGKLFYENPFDPRLKTHKLKGRLEGLWSFSVNFDYRILFEFRHDDIVWFHSVGKHNIYD
jgi:addiction module RelE/StbE family toxin